jgi:predicted oxidoreductase
MFDAIVVGARCAGAPTAMLLARKGYRVLLVDRSSFPSDTISTHVIWPQGAELLDRWGLLERLAATNCPPIARNMILDVGPFALEGGVPDANGGRGGFCPRRTVLDKMLVDAAVESGAELREHFTVEALTWDGDRVTGIKGRSHHGAPGRVSRQSRRSREAALPLHMRAREVRARAATITGAVQGAARQPRGDRPLLLGDQWRDAAAGVHESSKHRKNCQRCESFYRPSKRAVASPNRSRVTPMRSISDKCRLHALRFASPLSR